MADICVLFPHGVLENLWPQTSFSNASITGMIVTTFEGPVGRHTSIVAQDPSSTLKRRACDQNQSAREARGFEFTPRSCNVSINEGDGYFREAAKYQD
jgi:hypothetical protein